MDTRERFKIDLAKIFLKTNRPWLLEAKDGYTDEIKRIAMAELEEEKNEADRN
jgi:hypothetical protein